MKTGFVVSAAVLTIAVILGATPAFAERQGCSLTVYADADYKGASMTTSDDKDFVGDDFNHKISSVKVVSGFWTFYEGKNFTGDSMKLVPANYTFLGMDWNDRVSSFKCVLPTAPLQ